MTTPPINVPLLDLKAQYATIKNDIKAASCDTITAFDTTKLPASCQKC